MKTRYMIALYIAAMVAANLLLVYLLGKWSSPFIAFALIGFDLTMRDVMHSWQEARRWVESMERNRPRQSEWSFV